MTGGLLLWFLLAAAPIPTPSPLPTPTLEKRDPHLIAALEWRKFVEQLFAIGRCEEIVDDDMPERIAFAKARGVSFGVCLQARIEHRK